jgi:hypothetical protein
MHVHISIKLSKEFHRHIEYKRIPSPSEKEAFHHVTIRDIVNQYLYHVFLVLECMFFLLGELLQR